MSSRKRAIRTLLAASMSARRRACSLFDERPGRDSQTEEKRGHDGAGGREANLCRRTSFLKLIESAGRTGGDRLVVEMPLDVHRQAVGRFVTARAVFLQALHHDPVEVAAQQAERAWALRVPRRLAVVVSSSPCSVLSRVEGRAGSFSRIVRRISSRPACEQFLRVERRLAGEQFVEQHAQAVDVAARVDVQRCSSPPARDSCRPACR